MSHIMTVLGPIAPQALGFCQSHEHLCLLPGWCGRQNPPHRIDDRRLSTLELLDFYALGGRAAVDAQPAGCGRDGDFLADISQQSGVHIISSTGFHKLCFYPPDHWITTASEDMLAEMWQRELEEGMYAPCDTAPPERQTAVRAGQIKSAVNREGLTERYRLLFRAAAMAQKATGAPLMVHIERAGQAMETADFLEGLGVPPERVILCHLDRAEPDLSAHIALCRRGYALEYDTVARYQFHDDHHEAALVLSMLEAGCASSLLMGMDTTRIRLKHYGGPVGLSYFFTDFLPRLRRAGVEDSTFQQIFVENPARRFSVG